MLKKRFCTEESSTSKLVYKTLKITFYVLNDNFVYIQPFFVHDDTDLFFSFFFFRNIFISVWSLFSSFFFFFFRKILISFTCFFLKLFFVFLIKFIFNFKKCFLILFMKIFFIRNFFVTIFFIGSSSSEFFSSEFFL